MAEQQPSLQNLVEQVDIKNKPVSIADLQTEIANIRGDSYPLSMFDSAGRSMAKADEDRHDSGKAHASWSRTLLLCTSGIMSSIEPEYVITGELGRLRSSCETLILMFQNHETRLKEWKVKEEKDLAAIAANLPPAIPDETRRNVNMHHDMLDSHLMVALENELRAIAFTLVMRQKLERRALSAVDTFKTRDKMLAAVHVIEQKLKLSTLKEGNSLLDFEEFRAVLGPLITKMCLQAIIMSKRLSLASLSSLSCALDMIDFVHPQAEMGEFNGVRILREYMATETYKSSFEVAKDSCRHLSAKGDNHDLLEAMANKPPMKREDDEGAYQQWRHSVTRFTVSNMNALYMKLEHQARYSHKLKKNLAFEVKLMAQLLRVISSLFQLNPYHIKAMAKAVEMHEEAEELDRARLSELNSPLYVSLDADLREEFAAAVLKLHALNTEIKNHEINKELAQLVQEVNFLVVCNLNTQAIIFDIQLPPQALEDGDRILSDWTGVTVVEPDQDAVHETSPYVLPWSELWVRAHPFIRYYSRHVEHLKIKDDPKPQIELPKAAVAEAHDYELVEDETQQRPASPAEQAQKDQ